jgi:hypothetical protein
MKFWGGIICVVLLLVVIAWGSYHFQRWWNYTWSYESQVTDTICEMVKPEYLKHPEKC